MERGFSAEYVGGEVTSNLVKTKGMWYSSMDIKDYEQALLGTPCSARVVKPARL